MRPILLGFALLSACGPAAPRPPGSGAGGPAVVRLATWNVHDLFDEVDQAVPPGPLDDVPSPPEVEAHLDRVAAVLAALDADAVLLQEVENLPLLRRLAERGGWPEARLVEGHDPRGIDVALLSRLPVEAYLSHAAELGADGRPLWPRDAVEAVLGAGSGRLVIVGTHLSSHLSDPDGRRRALQAARLRAIADAAGPRWGAALVAVAGDLNDEADAPGLAPLLGDGAWLDAQGLAGAPAFTWSGGSSRATLDHFALPSEAAAALLSISVAGGATVAAASDHRPVVVDLLLR